MTQESKVDWWAALMAGRRLAAARPDGWTSTDLAWEAGVQATEKSTPTRIASAWCSKLFRWGYLEAVAHSPGPGLGTLWRLTPKGAAAIRRQKGERNRGGGELPGHPGVDLEEFGDELVRMALHCYGRLLEGARPAQAVAGLRGTGARTASRAAAAMLRAIAGVEKAKDRPGDPRKSERGR